MQKKLLAVAVLSAFSGLAAAQSANVTLYGTLQNELQMRSSTGADTAVAAGFTAGTGSTSTFRSAASYTATPQNYGSRMASQSAGSNFGVRGTEDLGNGLSAFFQLEIATTIGGPNAIGSAAGGTAATYRNTGLGLRSTTWGSIMFGQWDTPMDTVGNVSNNGETGGPTNNYTYTLIGGNAASSGSVSAQTFDGMCNAGGTGGTGAGAGLTGVGTTFASAFSQCLNHGSNFSRRQSGQLQWWSPNWNGFEARVAYVPTQFTSAGINGVAVAAAGNAFVNASGVAAPANSLAQLKPQQWDLAVSYLNGGLRLAAAYETKKDYIAQGVRTWYATLGTPTAVGGGFNTTAIGGGAAGSGIAGFSQDISGSSDRGYRLQGSYAFSNGFSAGLTYENLQWSMRYNTASAAAAGSSVNVTELKKTSWRLQAKYKTGKHTFTGEYTKAGNTTGSTDANGANAVASGFNGSASGARGMILGYNYAFSKRTSVLAYWNELKNDTNAAYSVTFGGIAGVRGAKQQYYGVGLRHAF